ncbi:charged multivesicular body protein 1 [Angomonas deanei]|nr:charged multivesicular body protein 1 [Angomonas deanei]|eukprot:EPY43675.1 charged multivesicular body protein 1 [Angomonas deanei]
MEIQFQLKFTAKQFAKNATKCEKEQKQEMNKCKKAMEKNNMEGARIYAENSIRKKNESLNHLRLAARMDAVVSRMDTAIKMKMVTKNMGDMVKGMDKVLKTMDPEKISKLMDQFEKQFETMDVTSAYMEGAIGQSVATSTPEDEVNNLMSQVADEHGLDIKDQLDHKLQISNQMPQNQVAQSSTKDSDDLEARLADLRR